jgi:sucrose-6-phosphate hydrolase SacC (GH32 family)
MTPGNRDPKVIPAPGGGHVMSLYLEKNQYALLTSDNLMDWTLQQTLDLPEDTECPDFYPLMPTPVPDVPTSAPDVPTSAPDVPTAPADADRQTPRWILSGAADRYLIGAFDGHAFVPEGTPGRLHWGAHAYAAQSWANVPASDGRRLRISWNTADIPGTAFNRSMTTPCEMTLQPRTHGPVLCIWPIREFESLRLQTTEVPAATLTPDAPLRLPLAVAPYDIACSLSWDVETTMVSLSLFGATLTLDPQARELRFLGATAPLPLTDHILSLRLIVDRHAMELYLDNGSAWLSQGHCLDANLARLEVQAEGGGATVSNLSLSPLRSIWEADA